MIIVSIGCGLGNQMFEYAFLIALMDRYPDVEFKIDNRYMLPIEHNGYELEKVFGISAEVCDKEDVIRLAEYCNENCFYRRIYHIRRKIKEILRLTKKSYFYQRDYTRFYEEVFQLNEAESYYLHGIWANSRYFESVQDKITEIFTFQKSLNKKTKDYKEKIIECLSISIHVRRGDYKENSKLILGEEYYRAAIELMEKYNKNINWFVFSDEIELVKELFEGKKYVTYIEGNKGEDSWMDMYLMSLCKHNIIANSSFSFWGAYLNKNPDKIVISSKKPFDKCTVPFTIDGWISI